jgi:hypothetical protein
MLQEYFEEDFQEMEDGFCTDELYIFTCNNGLPYFNCHNEDVLGEFKTLNDLITLCNLAGVNLTWKGESK